MKTTTADLGQNIQAKVTVRELANPIVDAATFNTIVQSVITDNPFGCVGYMANGRYQLPVEIIKEAYTARIIYKDNEGTVVGTGEETFNNSKEYTLGVPSLLANAYLTTAQGSYPIHDSKFDMFGATIKCHDINRDGYFVVFTRDEVVLAAYSNDSIRIAFEIWANTIPSLKSIDENSKRNHEGHLWNVPFYHA